MSEAKHTPGPWRVGVLGMDAKVVCPDGREFMIGDRIYHPENDANARLIAAAPLLLAACKAALPWLDEADAHGNLTHEIRAQLVTAVAAAEPTPDPRS